MKKIISLDFDDVINKIHNTTNAFLKEHYGVQVEPKDIPSWSYLIETYPRLVEAWSSFDYYKLGEPIEGSLEFLDKLKELSSYTKIVTNTYPSIILEKQKMIEEKYGPYEVIHTKDKHLYTKGSILIDDALHNIEAHVQHKNGPAIIFDLGYGWNQTPIENNYKDVYRAKSYEDVLYIIKNL